MAGPACVVIVSARGPLAITIWKLWKDKGLLPVRPGNPTAHLWSQREKSAYLWQRGRVGTDEPRFCFYWGGTDSCNFNKYFGIILDYGKVAKIAQSRNLNQGKKKKKPNSPHGQLLKSFKISKTKKRGSLYSVWLVICLSEMVILGWLGDQILSQGISLAVQWLRLCTSTAGAWVQLLVGELRSCMLSGDGQKKKEKESSSCITKKKKKMVRT